VTLLLGVGVIATDSDVKTEADGDATVKVR
jgi:hypothetical protein